MAQFEQFTYVDLSAGIRKVPVNGGIFSHDIKSHKLGVIVTNHNQPVTLTGQIMGIAKLATGEKLEFSGSIDDQDASRAYVELPESAYITGPLTVAIRNIDTNSNKIVLIAYTGYVDGATDGTPVVPPGTLPDDIEDFLAELDNMREIVADAEEAVENIDDIVLVQETQPTSEINKIWIQPQPDEYKVPTWEEYSDLKSAINPIGLVWHDGYIDNSGTIQAATNRSYTDLVVCPEGTVCKYVGETGNTSICSIAWYDKFGTFISGVTTSSTVGEERTETAPAGTYYCRLTTRNTILSSSYLHVQSNTVSGTIKNIYDAIQDIKNGDVFFYNNTATVSISNETVVAFNPVKTGTVYKISVTGESNVGVNVRSGNGRTVVSNIAVDCMGGNTYFVKYTGADADNLIIYSPGTCTVTIDDLTALKGKTERITVTVSNARELLEAIEVSHTVKMTIHLAQGQYDITAALGETYFNNAPAENFGPILANDVVLIGEEGAELTAHYTGTNANTMKYFSVFNAGQCVNPWNLSGSFELHNIHLSGSKIRYLIHDENNAYTGGYHNVYDGCVFYFDNHNNTEWSSQAIIGGGLGKRGYIEVINCIFETPTLNSRAAVLSYHNSTAANAKSHLVITGNLITPVNAALKLGYHGTTTEKTIVLASNNKWGFAPIVQAETAQDVEENIELIEWNNVVIS